MENEKGGSGLRYFSDIQNGTVTQEVGVDAKTGKVLENAPESRLNAKLGTQVSCYWYSGRPFGFPKSLHENQSI